MISVTQLRAGKTFQEKGEPLLVLKYEHSKLGRGTANIKVKVKNLKTGAIFEKTYLSGTRVEEILTTKRKLQYLYRDGENFYFMNPRTFEQFEILAKILAEKTKFLQEGVLVDVLFWSFDKTQEKPLSLELPAKMKFRVAETSPGLKGNSATNVFKDAVLESGLKLKVPLFVKEGDKIMIDTRTGEYVERAKD